MIDTRYNRGLVVGRSEKNFREHRGALLHSVAACPAGRSLGYTTCTSSRDCVCRFRVSTGSSLQNKTTIMAAANAVKRLIPLFDRVLIQRAEAITKTKGGIVLPEKAQAKVLRGTVVAIGPGAKNDKGYYMPLSIKIGDVVLLPEYGGTKVELDDNKEYHLFRESDILAKVEA